MAKKHVEDDAFNMLSKNVSPTISFRIKCEHYEKLTEHIAREMLLTKRKVTMSEIMNRAVKHYIDYLDEKEAKNV